MLNSLSTIFNNVDERLADIIERMTKT